MKIEIDNLSFRYGKSQPFALQDVNAAINPGVHLLLGENGAGKTTLLHIIDGLLFPTAGHCRIDGAETRHRLPSITSHVFYSGLDMQLGSVSVATLMITHARFYPNFSPDRLKGYLHRFGINAATHLDRLSEGQRQKALTAYALSLNAEITLLDEPATGMDIDSKDVLKAMIAESAEPSRTIIISTHNFADVKNLCDGIIMLRRSQLLFSMTNDEICGRVAFVTSKTRPEGAFFSELQGFAWHSIVDAQSEEADLPASDFDIRLLYKALHRKEGDNLLAHIRQ